MPIFAKFIRYWYLSKHLFGTLENKVYLSLVLTEGAPTAIARETVRILEDLMAVIHSFP